MQQLKADTVLEDIKIFEEVLTLNQKAEKTDNQENHIFRQIKLEKELNKIRKKVQEEMSKEELRKILPFEEFLNRALKDDSEEEDDDDIDKTNNNDDGN